MARKLIETEKSFLSVQKFDHPELIKECVNEIADKLLKNPPIFIYGKTAHQHRSIGFFSNTSVGYYYSRQLAKSQPLGEKLTMLLDQINDIFKTDFNGILINKYENGDDYISAHSDDETSLAEIGVVSLSYGAIRKFRIKDKKTKKIVLDIPTKNDEIIWMGGRFQQEFTHEIPIEKNINQLRYSFTFRKHIN
jgi:alkylated DNA repair dioxygenase AlkB